MLFAQNVIILQFRQSTIYQKCSSGDQGALVFTIKWKKSTRQIGTVPTSVLPHAAATNHLEPLKLFKNDLQRIYRERSQQRMIWKKLSWKIILKVWLVSEAVALDRIVSRLNKNISHFQSFFFKISHWGLLQTVESLDLGLFFRPIYERKKNLEDCKDNLGGWIIWLQGQCEWLDEQFDSWWTGLLLSRQEH